MQENQSLVLHHIAVTGLRNPHTRDRKCGTGIGAFLKPSRAFT